MSKLTLQSDPRVAKVFNAYPEHVRPKMNELRRLVIETANEIADIDRLEETLKWSEPSYLTKIGSTLRMDWKAKAPDRYAMYFSCTSLLVPTFKVVHGGTFQFEGNRGMVFGLEEEIPVPALKQCIAATLRYKRVKKQPMLGML